MTNDISHADARLALGSIEHRRQQIIDEIDMPHWYWWALAVGWVALGVLSDLANPWVTLGATLAFGATHAAVAQHVLSGRHRSPRLSVHRDVVSRRTPWLVVGFLVAMVVATMALGILIDADDARHPATIASGIVAVAVLAGGPRLMAAVRRHAARSIGQ